MKKIILGVFAFIALGLSSCSSISPYAGGVYTDVTSPFTATSNNLGTKVGISQATNILGIVALGDASIQEAAKQAGIQKISHVDQKRFSVLGVFARIETVVYGE